MAEPQERRRRIAVIIALVSAPILVAVVLAMVVLSARSEPEIEGKVEDTTPVLADPTLMDLPEGDYTAVCQSLEGIRTQLLAAVAANGADQPPAEVAALMAEVDISAIPVDAAPVGVQPTLAALVDGWTPAADSLRALPADATLDDATFEPAFIDAIGTIVSVGNQKCGFG